MTINSTTRVVTYNGNGSAATFAFGFKVFSAADLQVVRLVVASGVETPLVLTTDYTVTLNANQNSNPGGSVTLVAGALPSGYTITITSVIENLQPTDLTNQGGFYPEVISDSLDRATIQIQQISDIGDRAIKVPISDGNVSGITLPTATQRANAFLAFDAAGNPVAVASGSGAAPATVTRQTFSGTGSQTAFTLASAPGGLGNSAQVYINGIYQQRSTYTIGGTTLTFSEAPIAGTDNIEFVNFVTNDVGTTDAALVTYTPLGTGATQRVASDKFGELRSVKDFGATGNGVTNDAAAFTAAWNACNPSPVFVPSGTYAIGSAVSGSFITNGGVTITGAGSVNSISSYGLNAAIAGNATVTGNLTISGSMIGNETITGDLEVSGGDITTTNPTATVFNTNATTLNAGGAATTVNLGATAGTVRVGNLSMNAGYGSIAPVYGCRAWVQFNGSNAGTAPGGTCTATRSSGSTTCTITTSTAHGYLPGSFVRTSNTAIDTAIGTYVIQTVPSATTFTVTTTATGALSAVSVTFAVLQINASANITSVIDASLNNGDYIVNFATAMPDANYAVSLSATGGTSNYEGMNLNIGAVAGSGIPNGVSTAAIRIFSLSFGGGWIRPPAVCCTVFR